MHIGKFFHSFTIQILLMLPVSPLIAQHNSIVFKKRMIAAESYETVGVFDVNNDGKLDLVSGALWYEGPDFVTRHFITLPTRFDEYHNDYSTIPMDVDGDGWTDFITAGWEDQFIYWRKNPEARDREWQTQAIGKTGNVETTRAWDIDKDGTPEIVPNSRGPLKIFRLVKDSDGKGTGKFKEYVVHDTQGHGLGFGDVNEDGRGDLIISTGWLEAPQSPFHGKWIFHDEFQLMKASVPILVVDLNNDGLHDLIFGQGHDYGLDWLEQNKDQHGKRTWLKHAIDATASQYHTMEWADLDNDGKPELITGKRYRAHGDDDPGASDPIGLYYFKWNGVSFQKHVVSYGLLGEGKGTGNYFVVEDVDGNGRKDIVVGGKDGLFVFYNLE